MDKKLELLLKDKNCYFIHYASDGFDNGNKPYPKISCIAIYNDTLDSRVTFSISDYIGNNSVEESEKILLERFKTFLEETENISFIHWNMNNNGFGVKSIWARAEELGVELPAIPEENLYDLSAYVGYLAEKRLSLKQVLWFNSQLDREYLDGKTEAEYFGKQKFDEITQSVSLKVVGLYYVAQAIKDGTLKTEKPFKEPNDGLTKEERRQQAIKTAKARDEILKDAVERSRRLTRNSGEQAEREEQTAPEYQEEHGIFFLDFAHPIVSLFASWFANRK